ncbi:helix-turn-helix domain-containing protein [Streptomyces sp. 351MFTsu5.1]|uniref:helix-turn-helix domain-containing protein n=1 Tax=Streptomyces sp. 351MFTsu5.1 TaxID=1172180 RepID=UPI0003712AAF|nr:helix-turn-helix domain-containing protein [Streptomyces sp. 351MFTsu5.1]
MNLGEIARHAGASRNTVSCALSERLVLQDARRRIQQVVGEPGCRPSVGARALGAGGCFLYDEARRQTCTADATRAAALDELWTGGRFVARGADSAVAWGSSSRLGLMPSARGEHLPEHIAKNPATRIEAHLAPYRLPPN